jgi:predicted O-methyltransferase YrrM
LKKSIPVAIDKVSLWYEIGLARRWFDPCPAIQGMSSIKKLQLLHIAYGCLSVDECYVEIGTYTGKSLISALLDNPVRKTYACDNFSQFNDNSSEETLNKNLERYAVKDRVTFFNNDFRKIMDSTLIQERIGVYYFDGGHDLDSQYQGIALAEGLFANEALVIVDDWRFADDSQSYAKAGTMKAVEESPHRYELLYELPARFNGDHAMWWNGVGVLAFYRKS